MTQLLELLRAVFAIILAMPVYLITHPIVALGAFLVCSAVVLMAIDTDRRHDR